MTFLLVHGNTDLYGASRSLLRLSRRLIRDGHRVEVVLPGNGTLNGALAAAGVTVHIVPRLATIRRTPLQGRFGTVALFGRTLSSTWSIARIIRRVRPDVVHTNVAVVLSGALAAIVCRVPHVWHIREFFVEFPRMWPVYRRFLTATGQRIVCVSNAVADQFTGRDRDQRVVVLHNGLPREEFVAIDDQRVTSFRARHGLGTSMLFGVLGRIKCHRKGQDVFVRAVADLRGTCEDARFVIVGSPFPGNEEHLEEIERLIGQLGLCDRVVLTGEPDDIKAAISAMDVVVLPSAQPEPFGGIVLEAMAFGKPVIGTAIGGTIEQIEHNETGLLVRENDAAALANAMEVLANDPVARRTMGLAARARFEACFEFDHFYAGLHEVYQEAVSRRSSGSFTQPVGY